MNNNSVADSNFSFANEYLAFNINLIIEREREREEEERKEWATFGSEGNQSNW